VHAPANNLMSGDMCTINILTERERDVLKLIGRGYTSKEIAAMLDLSPETIGHHRKNIRRKLDLHSTASLAAYGALLLAGES
jgi:DNA-binding CsgD family transcriptional regulator